MWLRWQNASQLDVRHCLGFLLNGIAYSQSQIHVAFVKTLLSLIKMKRNEIRLPNNIKNISFALFAIPSKCMKHENHIFLLHRSSSTCVCVFDVLTQLHTPNDGYSNRRVHLSFSIFLVVFVQHVNIQRHTHTHTNSIHRMQGERKETTFCHVFEETSKVNFISIDVAIFPIFLFFPLSCSLVRFSGDGDGLVRLQGIRVCHHTLASMFVPSILQFAKSFQFKVFHFLLLSAKDATALSLSLTLLGTNTGKSKDITCTEWRVWNLLTHTKFENNSKSIRFDMNWRKHQNNNKTYR